MNNEDPSPNNKFLGWIALWISTTITSFWAFWGVIENFHEGWYYPSIWLNLGLMLSQYLSPMLMGMALTVASINWRRAGAGLHWLLALAAIWFFRAFDNTATFFIILPLFGMGLLYWFGRPTPRRIAKLIAIGVPLLVFIVSGVKPALRVSARVDDGNRSTRFVQGNEVALYWAPQGPGWPERGGDWYEANRSCRFLSEDGRTLESVTQQIWRLPTVSESVRSMTLHGKNSGGKWDASQAQASYENAPDKESPLWDINSLVIYWWTASEIDDERAYIIAYDGAVWSRSKDIGPDNLGFRCVKDP